MPKSHRNRKLYALTVYPKFGGDFGLAKMFTVDDGFGCLTKGV